MEDYTLDFMDADQEYAITNGMLREWVGFIINLSGGESYRVEMKALWRVQTTFEFCIGKIVGYPGAECYRGFIIVEELNLDTLHGVLKDAMAQGYFSSLTSLVEMPLDFKTKQDLNRQLGRSTIVDVTTQTHYLGLRLEQTLVTVAFDKGFQYMLTLVSPEAIAEYFGQIPGERFLAIPGLVVVHDIQQANLEMIVAWCHREQYFITLKPM